MKIYVDGAYYPKEEAKLSVFDHGLLYGDGIFEGIRVYGGRAFRLRAHLERLARSAKAMLLDIPMSLDELYAEVVRAIELNEKAEGYIRLLVTRGAGDLGASPATCPKASVVIIVGDIQLYPQEMYESGIPVITSSLRRIGPECFDVRIKSLNYLNNVLAKIEARRAGCMEAVMLNAQGHVAECTVDNIFAVRAGVLLTPLSTEGALEGITRASVLETAEMLGMPWKEAVLTQYDLYNADECFITGTGAELMPVTSVDGRVVGDGKAGAWTKRLWARFKEAVRAGEFAD